MCGTQADLDNAVGSLLYAVAAVGGVFFIYILHWFCCLSRKEGKWTGRNDKESVGQMCCGCLDQTRHCLGLGCDRVFYYILCAPCRLCYCCYYGRSQLLERDPTFGKEAGRVRKNELTEVGGAPAVMEMTV